MFARGRGRSSDEPVECLGLSFANDDERRAHFAGLLREKLMDPEYRTMDGFPIGEDEDILALSDPPYYTACPNPWLMDFVTRFGTPYDTQTDNYAREPFAADVSEGKSDPIYNAHSYHTKVPHKAIMRYILHYTEPGDVVFDGFCGSGMTGVAAQLCGDRNAVESLGYAVQSDGTILDEHGRTFSRLGARHPILNDLSPASAFIASNYNVPFDVDVFERDAKSLLDEFESEWGWMYLTLRDPSDAELEAAVALLAGPGFDFVERAPHLPWARIDYTVWSDVFSCPGCARELIYWQIAVDQGDVQSEAQCPDCGVRMSKQELSRLTQTVTKDGGSVTAKAKRVPVEIHARTGKERWQKSPDAFDLELIRVLERVDPPDWYPTRRIDEDIDLWYERDYRSLGIDSIDDFFGKRGLILLSWLRSRIWRKKGRGLRAQWFWVQSVLMGFSLMNRFLKNAFSQVNRILSGTLYVGAMQSEVAPWYSLTGKIRRLRVLETVGRHDCAVVSCGDTATIPLPSTGLDYVFVDPPFGSNIIYSDLSIVWEAWLRLYTNTDRETVVHRRKRSGLTLPDYARMMTEAFRTMYHALKPGRWMTVEFHNSRNSVWHAIQEALSSAGFVVADVRTLDKHVGSFKQVTAAGAVKQDLVISAYRPRADIEREFTLEGGTSEAAWMFVRGHLRQLPVVVERDSILEIVTERQDYLLYDRMVAFHVQRGVQVPLSAAEFYAGLEQRFPCRDTMYFLPEQVAEYDSRRLQSHDVKQLELFVTDEESAIQWLRRTLTDKPMSFQDIHPLFMREIAGWEKHEKALELAELLEENFIRYDGEGEVPSQIHAYLSSNFREMRGLEKSDAALRAKGRDRWFVPDPRKAGDLEQLRERTLLREFDDYSAGRGKLRLFRLEAVRAGFKRAWQERDYETIISVAERLPANDLQEDAKLLMWYDQALTRAGE